MSLSAVELKRITRFILDEVEWSVAALVAGDQERLIYRGAIQNILVKQYHDLLKEERIAEHEMNDRCPICHETVELALPQASEPWKVRDQIQFCSAHQKDSAEREWKRRKYPDIDWDCLDARLRQARNQIEQILRSTVTSDYRAEMEMSLRESRTSFIRNNSKNRTGYYGLRGEQIM